MSRINLTCNFDEFQLIDGLQKIHSECSNEAKVRINPKKPSDVTYIGKRPQAFAYLNCFRQKLKEDKMCKNCLIRKHLNTIENILIPNISK